MKRVIVTGAGGFIGHHLVRYLKKQGHWVKGIDLKMPEFSKSEADAFILADLRNKEGLEEMFEGVEEIYALASDVGGVGYLSQNKYSLMRNNIEIDLNTIEAAIKYMKKILYVSSACVYRIDRQATTSPEPLKEDDVCPANPENAYGWQKLLTERLLLTAKDEGLDVRIVRPQNVYGPEDTFQGGREKSIGALCRKVAIANPKGTVEIWGDGSQTRSYCYIDDVVEGFVKVMESNLKEPLNLSSEGNVSLQRVADILNNISGKNLSYSYNLSGAQGVRGRQSDNTLIKSIGWQPKVSLERGLEMTYNWVESQIK